MVTSHSTVATESLQVEVLPPDDCQVNPLVYDQSFCVALKHPALDDPQEAFLFFQLKKWPDLTSVIYTD